MVDAKITNFIGRMLREIIKEEDMYESMREAIKSLGFEKKAQETRINKFEKRINANRRKR